MEPTPLDLPAAHGTLRAHRFGRGGPLCLCVPGLTANSRSFDWLAARLAAGGRTVVALDLRGRGFSAPTAPGSYGWRRHAEDVLAAAGALGAETFDWVGHSMGAYVGMEAALLAPGRVRRLALVDAAGTPEPSSLAPIFGAVERLGRVHASEEAFLAAVQKMGTVTPWAEHWERHYRYELEPAPGGGVRARTDRAAVLEDVAYGSLQRPRERWRALAMPALLVRAARPLTPGSGFVVSAADFHDFPTFAPRGQAASVDANHYGVIAHDATLAALERFLA